jgi:uncharacterized cysteine cluster protein YcgN (CxxCxxCC family)
VQQRNSEFSKWSDTIDSTENVEMERQHQRRLVVVQSCMNCTPGNVIRVESFASSCSLRRVRNEELFRSV